MTSTNKVVANAMAARGVATNADKTVSQITKEWNDAAKELEAMVAKVAPWRDQMKKMRKRQEELSGLWYPTIPKDDPGAQKAQEAYMRYESAKSKAADLWYSI